MLLAFEPMLDAVFHPDSLGVLLHFCDLLLDSLLSLKRRNRIMDTDTASNQEQDGDG